MTLAENELNIHRLGEKQPYQEDAVSVDIVESEHECTFIFYYRDLGKYNSHM